MAGARINKNRKNAAPTRKFTKREFVIVSTLVCVLVGIAFTLGSGPDRKDQIATTQQRVDKISKAMYRYADMIGHFPDKREGLKVLLDPMKNGEVPLPSGDVSQLNDAWGRAIHFQSPGDHHRDFDLWSAGPDGIEGNEDDVCNWMKI